jgi:hypothetical protein
MIETGVRKRRTEAHQEGRQCQDGHDDGALGEGTIQVIAQRQGQIVQKEPNEAGVHD